MKLKDELADAHNALAAAAATDPPDPDRSREALANARHALRAATGGEVDPFTRAASDVLTGALMTISIGARGEVPDWIVDLAAEILALDLGPLRAAIERAGREAATWAPAPPRPRGRPARDK